jgi:hypothetical protein
MLWNLMPLVQASDFAAPTPVIIGIVLIVVGLLVLRFVIKTAITLVKIAILAAIGLGVYLGLSFLFGS